MVGCMASYDFVGMSSQERLRILTSGPARFQRLTAFHPSITSRYIENLGSELPSTFPRSLFTVYCNLEVFSAHINNFIPFNSELRPHIKIMLDFCAGLSKIYQVKIKILPNLSHIFLSICPFGHCVYFFSFFFKHNLVCPFCPFVQFVHQVQFYFNFNHFFSAIYICWFWCHRVCAVLQIRMQFPTNGKSYTFLKKLYIWIVICSRLYKSLIVHIPG